MLGPDPDIAAFRRSTTEIVSGLSEGQQVVISTGSTSGTGGFPGGGFPGGGFGGIPGGGPGGP